jgi:hypothetical protein
LRFDDACYIGLTLTHEEGRQDQDGETDTNEAIAKILLLEIFQTLEYFCAL